LNCDGTCVNDLNQDGVCDELVSGCSVIGACNYDSTDSNADDDVCYFPGCSDFNACNFNANAACDNGSCTYPGCTDTLACNYDVTAGCDDNSCSFPGCTDALACNFQPNAGCSDSSCFYSPNFYDCDGICLNDDDADGICNELETNGCTDSIACNFNPFALNNEALAPTRDALTKTHATSTSWPDAMAAYAFSQVALILRLAIMMLPLGVITTLVHTLRLITTVPEIATAI
jgi:hypothetical protein